MHFHVHRDRPSHSQTPFLLVQIEDKSLIFKNLCVQVELWPSETQESGRYEVRQANCGPFFFNFERDVDTFNPVIYTTIAEPTKR